MVKFNSYVKHLGQHQVVEKMMHPNTAQIVVPENARSWIASSYIANGGKTPLIIVTLSLKQAENLAHDIRQLWPNIDLELFPSWETLPFERVSPQVQNMGRRNNVLWRLRSGNFPEVIVATARSISQIIADKCFDDPITITINEEISYETLLSKILAFGYKRTSQVERCGEYSVRGSIVDIYPSTAQEPIRIEMWGDEVERLTTFSIVDQRSKSKLHSFQVFPASEILINNELKVKGHELLSDLPWGNKYWEIISEGGSFDGIENLLPSLTPKRETIFDLLPATSTTLLFESEEIAKRITDLLLEEQNISSMLSATWSGGVNIAPETLHLEFDKIFKSEKCRTLRIDSSTPDLREADIEAYSPVETNSDPVVILKQLVKKSFEIIIISESEKTIEKLLNKLSKNDLDGSVHIGDSPIPPKRGLTVTSDFDMPSIVFPQLKFAVINERELFRRRLSPRKSKSRQASTTTTFADFKKGSFVVHDHHGIAIFQGIVKRALGNIERDYLLLEYRKGDKLYVPTDQVHQVSQYSSGGAPSLSRMGGSDWSRTRNSVRYEIARVAEELVSLYQQRESKEGFSFSQDSPWQRELEESFPFVETADQITAMNDVKGDMEQSMPMDRLVCGDVGFGKTEIALRAAFKAIQDSKQVALLVPTTLLAQQHYQTFTERLNPFPINVEVLSRFIAQKEAKEIISSVRDGEVDLVIGTHRLLSEDIEYRDLGLLIIDEEQRFGVSHKEKIKSLKSNVDVLTLTATPIPRTLEMSLTGIRDLTLLNTPPTDRKPIMTYVGEYEDSIVSAAIRREMLRDGQVFFVHNKISDIENVADALRSKVPSAKIATAHGQMDEGTLEQTVIDFWNKKYDVLVCTTIIESGIDMPTVNTLIVDGADRMGLGQLHQLRGRVGRSEVKAYAYLLTPKGQRLGEDAIERLKTVGETSELGSGFKIAMRDLEIRGAGNLLGTGQSGHIAAVGYDLYCKLVKEAVEGLKQIPQESHRDIDIELPVTAYIPNDFIAREDSKLESYQAIADAKRDKDLEDIQQTWLDRYGPVPDEAVNLLKIAYLKLVARSLGIEKIIAKKIPGFGKAEWNIHISPLKLRPSQRVRTLRIYDGSLYKEEQEELILKIPQISEASQEITEYLGTLAGTDKEDLK